MVTCIFEMFGRSVPSISVCAKIRSDKLRHLQAALLPNCHGNSGPDDDRAVFKSMKLQVETLWQCYNIEL